MSFGEQIESASECLLRDFFRQLPEDLNKQLATISNNIDSLYPSELELIERARSDRRNEFSTGRLLMRRALREANIADCAIVAGSLGQPLWPTGIVGSLSHSREICALVTGPASTYIGIGFDLELSTSDISETAEILLSPQEKALDYSADRLRSVFCAKEAVYKCVSPLTRQFMEFDELSIVFRECTFQAHTRKSTIPQPMLDSGFGLILQSGSGVAAAYIIPNA